MMKNKILTLLLIVLSFEVVGQSKFGNFLSKTHLKIQFSPEGRFFTLPQLTDDEGEDVNQFGIQPRIGLAYRSLPIFEYGQFIKLQTTNKNDEPINSNLAFGTSGVKNQFIHIGTGLIYGLLGNGETKSGTLIRYILSSIEFRSISTGINNVPVKANENVLMIFGGSQTLIENDDLFSVSSKFSNKTFYMTIRPKAYKNIKKYNDPYYNDEYKGGITFALGYYNQKLHGFTDNYLYKTTTLIGNKKYTNAYFNRYVSNGFFIGGGYEFDEGEKGGIKTTLGLLQPINGKILNENGEDVINSQLANLNGYKLPGGFFSMRAVMKSGNFNYGFNIDAFFLFGQSDEYKFADENTEHFLFSANGNMNVSFTWNIPLKKKINQNH